MDNLNLISNFAEFKELKNIDKSTMIGVLEDVFRHALQKQYETDENFDVIINPEKGDLEIWRNRTVVEDGAVEDPNAQIAVSEVKAIDPTYEIGDEYADEIKLASFGRRTVLSLRQNLASRILDLEKASLYEKYSEKVGEIVTGEVYQVWKKEVLILDEPGNDLDTDMLAVVEDLLDAWPGTLLLVTHDRYLMERVTDHQFALVNGKIRHLPGGVDEYLRLSDASPSSMAAGSPARQRPAHAADSGLSGTEASPESSRLSGGEQRTLRKLMQSNERKVETLNGKIEDVRASMAAADPTDFTALGDFQAQISDLQQQIDALEEEWMEAAEKLGE